MALTGQQLADALYRFADPGGIVRVSTPHGTYEILDLTRSTVYGYTLLIAGEAKE